MSSKKYLQGLFYPKNPHKYIGDVRNIVYRSSWEKKLMIYLDMNPSILKWGSEELVIPYLNEVDNRVHRYYPDMVIQYKTRRNEVKHAVIEVKPMRQVRAPVLPASGKQTKRYINEMVTYVTNKSKWKAAQEWCVKNGFDFIILTENELKV